jgi:dTDP-4-amino-4,6-dideoxygalactose transaminase
MDEIMGIASKHSIHVLEDSYQSIGATFKSRLTGSLDSCAFYFF